MISPSAELDSATSHRPGSPEKLRLLRARAAANLPLHIPGDAYLEHSPADLHQMLDMLSAAERDVRDLKALMAARTPPPRSVHDVVRPPTPRLCETCGKIILGRANCVGCAPKDPPKRLTTRELVEANS